MPRTTSLIASTAVACLFAATSASAAPWEPRAKPARQLLKEGADAFDAADYARAAALFLQSWEAQPSHLARWNAAQSYAAAGDWRRALDLFEQLLADRTLPRRERTTIATRRKHAAAFIAAQAAASESRWDDARARYLEILDAEDVDPRDRKHASTALDALAQARAAAESAARAQTSTTNEPPPTGQPTSEPPTTRGSSTALVVSPSPPHEAPTTPRPSRWSDTAALVMVGAGAVAIGVGAGLRWHATDLDDQADDPATPESDRRELIDKADGARTGSAIAFAAGGALVIVGAIKLAIPPSMPAASLATVAPTQGGALMVLGGRF